MTIDVNATAVSKNSYKVITGNAIVSGSISTRTSYDRKRPNVARSFFPATPFDAQSLAGTGALVFEGEMIGSGN